MGATHRAKKQLVTEKKMEELRSNNTGQAVPRTKAARARAARAVAREQKLVLMTEEERVVYLAKERKTQIIGLVALVVIVALIFVGIFVKNKLSPPISRQNCSQLAATYRHIAKVEDADASVESVRGAMNDAAALNSRIDELGGCPDQPSLQ